MSDFLVARHPICPTSHLRDISFARHFVCATFQVRDIPFTRHPICATFHLRDISFARLFSCAISHLRDIPVARHLICATFQLRDISFERQPICATFFPALLLNLVATFSYRWHHQGVAVFPGRWRLALLAPAVHIALFALGQGVSTIFSVQNQCAYNEN